MSSPELTVLQIQLKEAFKRLIGYQRLESEKPLAKFKIIESQLTALFQILVTWTQYCEFLYIPDAQLDQIRVEETKEDDFEGKLKNQGLFTPEEKEQMKETFGDKIFDYLNELKPDGLEVNPSDFSDEETRVGGSVGLERKKEKLRQLTKKMEKLEKNTNDEQEENTSDEDLTETEKANKRLLAEFGTNRRTERMKLLNQLYGGFGNGNN